MLALAGMLCLVKSGQDADYAEQWSGEIADRQAYADGRIVRSAGGHHGAAQSLDNGVHRFRRARIRSASESSDRAIDDPRIDLPREGVTDSKPVHRAAAGVLDDECRIS